MGRASRRAGARRPVNNAGTFSTGEVLIAAKSIGKTFGSRAILRDIDLEVRRRQVVTLIGPNGAGKTTLVRILLGLLRADGGSVRRREGLRLGYVPQKIAIEPTLPLTVHRFLRFATPKAGDLIAETLESLNIADLREQQMTAVSGGELQRVLLARALLRDPHLLVLDEPAQGVDLTGQAELYKLIGGIRTGRGCGVLMISHDLHLVMSSTDEVICLNHHVCCRGKPEQVSGDPAFLDLFGAAASPDLAVYTHSHHHEHDVRGDVKSAPE